MKIFIVNGSPRSGKTTFETFVQEHLGFKNVYILSIIDPIKRMAEIVGYKGTKSNKDRKFLSDLKDLVDGYNNYLFEYIREELRFIQSVQKNHNQDLDKVIVFIDSRETKDISYLKETFNAKTIYVDKEQSKNVELSNHADTESSNKENYNYDIIIDNNYCLDILKEKAIKFCEEYC